MSNKEKRPVPEILCRAFDMLDVPAFIAERGGTVLYKNIHARVSIVSPRIGSSIYSNVKKRLGKTAVGSNERGDTIVCLCNLLPEAVVIGNNNLSFPTLAFVINYQGSEYIAALFFNNMQYLGKGDEDFYASLIDLIPSFNKIITENCIAVQNGAKVGDSNYSRTYYLTTHTARVIEMIDQYYEEYARIETIIKMLNIYFGFLRNIGHNVEFFTGEFIGKTIYVKNYKEFISCVTTIGTAISPYLDDSGEAAITFDVRLENGALVFDGFFNRNIETARCFGSSAMLTTAKRKSEYYGFDIGLKCSKKSRASQIEIKIAAERLRITDDSLRSGDVIDDGAELLRLFEKIIGEGNYTAE